MLLQMVLCHSFEWLSYIPLYVWNRFFIHSFVNVHLGYFQVLGSVNSAAVNDVVHDPLGSCFSLDICPGMGLHGYMVTLILGF